MKKTKFEFEIVSRNECGNVIPKREQTDKKLVLYYANDHSIVGWREHHFDWKEGDTIYTDGVRCTIYCVIEDCYFHRQLVKLMIKFVRMIAANTKLSKEVKFTKKIEVVDKILDVVEQFDGLDVEIM